MKNLIALVVLMGLGSVTLAQDLPNADFQIWVDSTDYEDPEFWSTPNPFTSPSPISTITVTKSTDAYSGDFSARLETKDILYNLHQIPGLLTLAQFSIDFDNLTFNICGGHALQENVTKFMGMYKYQGADGDSASVLIYNYRLDDNGEMDTIGHGTGYLHDTASWTLFTINMEILNDHVPDTFNVIIMSSTMSSSGFEFNSGSILYVDSLAIETSTGMINLDAHNIIVDVYPNPSSGFVQFETREVEKDRQIGIYDAVGKLIGISNFSESKTKIHVKDFPPGLYTYRVTKHNQLLNSGSFIKK